MNLFSKRFTVVPVVEHLHWSVAVFANLDDLDGHWKRWRSRKLLLRAKEQEQQHQQRSGGIGGGGSGCDGIGGSTRSAKRKVDDDDVGDDEKGLLEFSPHDAPSAVGEATLADSEDSGTFFSEAGNAALGSKGVSNHADSKAGAPDAATALVPCIVLMDSLKMHAAQQVAANLRSYLLHEYRAVSLAKKTARETARETKGDGTPTKRQRGWVAGEGAAGEAAGRASS